jgi:aspartate kinase
MQVYSRIKNLKGVHDSYAEFIQRLKINYFRMKVLKFGSSTVASADKIKEVARLVSGRKGEKNMVVLSAMSGTTDALLEIADYLYKKNPDGAKELINNLERKYLILSSELFTDAEQVKKINKELTNCFDEIRALSKDIFTLFEEKKIVAQGELLISYLFTQYLSDTGINVKLIPALEFMRIDKNEEPDSYFIKENLIKQLEIAGDADIYVTQGFICRNAYNEIDNLKQGGGDYTATLIGSALQAEEIQIWTRSEGIYNIDPTIIQNAYPVEKLSFDQAAELSYFGNKVLYPTSILPAKLDNIPVRLLNVQQPEANGTLISINFTPKKIEAVAAKEGITAIKIKSGRMLFAYGFLRRIFEIFESYKTPIDMITTSEVGVSVTIDNNKHLDEILDELKKFGTVSVQTNMVIIGVVGDLSDENVGSQVKILNALNEIPIRMITYGGSLHNVSVLIHANDKVKALQALNKTLFI